MRRLASLMLLAAVLLVQPAAARADAVPAASSHGPDPAAIDAGPELAPAPSRTTRARGGARAASSTRLPRTWCGEERTADETRNELQNGDHRYHAIYAVPADAPSRLRSVAGQLQTDAMTASGLLEQLYGRAIRFDMGTSCGAQYLDISVVRLPQTSAQMAQLAQTATGTLDAVADAVDAQGFEVIKPYESTTAAARRTRNWIVWLDAPGPAGACGQAMLYDDPSRSGSNFNNLAGKVALVFRDGDGFCGANSVRHEIAHNLGAVVSDAPHATGGHCDDAIEDTMCVPGSPRRANGAYHALYFDYGNDDYWDPPQGTPLPWWTVNLSRFLCGDANCNVPPGYAGADSDGDGVPDAADNCPTRANADQRNTRGSSAGDACERSARRRVPVRVKARRKGRRWKVVVRARGRGRAVVSIRCRRARGARVKVAWRRRASLPRTLRSKVRCASKPRAMAVLEARPARKR